jgi:hypothetical protein
MRNSDTAIQKCALVILTAGIALAGATQAFAIPDDVIHQYFPLHVGDRWVYVKTAVQNIDPEPQDPYAMQEVETISSYRHEGRTIFRMRNYTFGLAASELDFFNDQNGRVIEMAMGQAGTWYHWDPAGSTIELPAFGSDCVHGSLGIGFGLATAATPAGTWDECLVIEYRSTPCQEVGLVREVFAPGLGLVERTVRTTVGRETWSLKYAAINGYEFGGVAIDPLPELRPADQENAAMPVAESTWGAIKSAYAE